MDTAVANEAYLQSSSEETDGLPLRHLRCSRAKGCPGDAVDNTVCLIFFLFVFSVFDKIVLVIKTLM